jgi:hypothetical protein
MDPINHPLADAPLIFAYTRRQAIEGGVLIDITEQAVPLGLRWHTCITDTAWARCVALPTPLPPHMVGQSETGRLRNVIWMATLQLRAERRRKSAERRAQFSVRVLQPDHAQPMLHRLWIDVGPGDRGEPVITIMTNTDL